MFGNLIASLMLATSFGTPSLKNIAPKRAVNDTYEASISVYGSYNFKQSPSWSYPQQYFTYRYEFEQSDMTGGGPYFHNVVPFTTNDGQSAQMFLRYIDLEYDDGYTAIEFGCYDGQEDLYTYSTVYNGDLEDVSLRSMIFNVNSPYYFNGVAGWFFQNFFTHAENSYVINYSGYYYLNGTTTALTTKFSVIGATMFNQQGGSNFTNYGFQNSQFGILQYDITNNRYDYHLYEIPFNKSYVMDSNFNFNGVKMSVETKAYLESVGFFGYVRDTSYDHATFKDLLFGVLDSPIYMMSKLLSFELFGVNLFVALGGLVTLLLILLVARKFF